MADGNIAAMREALETMVNCIDWLCEGDKTGRISKQFAPLLSQARAALDAPARNCDKYGADGAAVACRKALGIDWSHIILVRKVIGWLFSTEGGQE